MAQEPPADTKPPVICTTCHKPLDPDWAWRWRAMQAQCPSWWDTCRACAADVADVVIARTNAWAKMYEQMRGRVALAPQLAKFLTENPSASATAVKAHFRDYTKGELLAAYDRLIEELKARGDITSAAQQAKNSKPLRPPVTSYGQATIDFDT